jgi:hypothetical protein
MQGDRNKSQLLQHCVWGFDNGKLYLNNNPINNHSFATTTSCLNKKIDEYANGIMHIYERFVCLRIIWDQIAFM